MGNPMIYSRLTPRTIAKTDDKVRLIGRLFSLRRPHQSQILSICRRRQKQKRATPVAGPITTKHQICAYNVKTNSQYFQVHELREYVCGELDIVEVQVPDRGKNKDGCSKEPQVATVDGSIVQRQITAGKIWPNIWFMPPTSTACR